VDTRRPVLPLVAVALLAAGGVLALALTVAEPRSGAPSSAARAGRGGGTPTAPVTPGPSRASPEAAAGSSTRPDASAAQSQAGTPAAPLPVAIASIGDSLSVAFDADGRFGPAPEHSWVVGTDPNDGVDSHLERLRRLGDASILVIDAARAGATIGDAARQATSVVTRLAASDARGGVYVTFELGANDVCGSPPGGATPAARFRTALTAALGILRDGATVGGRAVPGLPSGSRLLLLSVPDLLRLRSAMAGVPAAQEVYSRFGICSSALAPGRTPAELSAVARTLSAYDRAIRDACAAIERTDGAAGRLHCRTDQSSAPDGSLATAPFTPADISALDYFHPSLRGQARIADGAWRASYWADAAIR
jgi:lysophospholipase L1-like esterase